MSLRLSLSLSLNLTRHVDEEELATGLNVPTFLVHGDQVGVMVILGLRLGLWLY